MIGRSEKTIACRQIALYHFNQYLTGHSLGFPDLDIDAIEGFLRQWIIHCLPAIPVPTI